MTANTLFKTIMTIFHGWKNLILDIFSDVKYHKYFERRLKICKSCEYHTAGICRVCGCIIKAKTMAEDSECPKKKWYTIEETLKIEKIIRKKRYYQKKKNNKPKPKATK